MALIAFVLFGFVVGLVARALMPGPQPMGFIMTAVLGMAGSVLGGFVTKVFTHEPVAELRGAGLLGSLIGALVLLAIYSRFAHGGGGRPGRPGRVT
jgi:uncharacterized membrane protein YeaQ/YmgE (transglycosylase-associated protein family)